MVEVYLALSKDSSTSSPGRTKLKIEVPVSLKEEIGLPGFDPVGSAGRKPGAECAAAQMFAQDAG